VKLPRVPGIFELLRNYYRDDAARGRTSGERTVAHAAVASLGQRLLPRLGSRCPVTCGKGVVLAVGIRIKLPGVTQEQFDAAHDHINPDRSPWPGLLFHSSGPIDGGWGVIDFWESRADFDAHLEANIQPGIAASGVQMQGPPEIKEFPVHEIIHP
jgi:hypothetical protein